MIRKKIMPALNLGTLAMLVCAGCRSKEMPHPPEFTHVPVYVAAQTIPADDQAKIRSSSAMRAYAVGRYVDPNRGTVMHEQHTIYREEQSPRWNLIPQPDADPVLTAQKAQRERYADALAGQINLAARDMRDTRELVKKALAGQSSQEARTRELVNILEDVKKRYGVVSGNLSRSSEYINKLEAGLNKLRQETELLKLQLRKRGNAQ